MTELVRSGWNTLLLGAGGLLTGFDFGPDGTMACRADTHNAYRWSGTIDTITNPDDTWIPLITLASMENSVVGTQIATLPMFGNMGAYELVIAPSNTDRLMMISPDVSDQNGDIWFAAYISNDAGATWTRVNDVTNFPRFKNAGSNGSFKNYSGKIAIDPNNADVMYVGMPFNSNNTYPVYRSIDGGVTWDGAFCSGVISAATDDAGVSGMMFDGNYGTTTVGGQTRSKRLLLPVTGVGVYESWDGGQTFTLTSSGPTKGFYSEGMDFDGVYYVSDWDLATGALWRYIIGASQGNGTWANLTTATGWPSASVVSASHAVDPRSGSQGLVWQSYNGDGFHGYKSSNANNPTANSVTWAGSMGSPAGTVSAPSYDLPWLNRTRVVFVGMARMKCDKNGVVWWAGDQGFWFNTMPMYSPNVVAAHSVSRGIEQMVTAAACRPPGSLYAFLGNQDCALFRTSDFAAYPGITDRYPDATVFAQRSDCTSIDWAASDPTFLVARVGRELRPANEVGSHWSAYSSDGGLTFTPYTTQPDGLYGAIASTGGYIIAFDHDIHVCVPAPHSTAIKPCRTTNARSASCSWSLCNDLPSVVWIKGPGFGFQKNSRPIAIDRVTVGAAYIWDDTTGDLWRTTDSGATWAVAGNRTLPATTSQIFLYSVPGYAGHLWLTGYYTGGTPAIYRSTDGGVTWTNSGLTIPGGGYPFRFTLGAGRKAGDYPALYMMTKLSTWSQQSFYRSVDQGVTWTKFGEIPTDIPDLTQLDFPKTFEGDWAIFGLVYYGTGGAGFVYYSEFDFDPLTNNRYRRIRMT